MGKSVNNDVLDGALNIVKNNCDLMTVCNAEPTTRTQAVTTYALADVGMDSADFTISDGDGSGRKITVTAQSGVTIDTSGTASHVALVDATRLLYVTTCTAQVLTSGNTVDFPAWKIEISDPS